MFEFEESKNSVDYMNAYLKDEKIIVNDLINSLNSSLYYYNTNNSSKLNDLIYDLITSLKQADKNFTTNIDIIERNILSYKESKDEAENEVLDILENNNIKTIDWGFEYGWVKDRKV